MKTIKKIDIIEDITSHYAMKLITAAYPPILNQILSFETELFTKMIERSMKESLNSGRPIVSTEKELVYYDELFKYLFKSIFDEDVDLDSLHFDYEIDEKRKRKKVDDGIIKIYWTRVAKMLDKLNNFKMDHGMVEIQWKYFINIISMNVKNIFEKSFKEYMESVQEEFLDPYRNIIKEIFSDFEESKNFTIDCKDIEEILTNSPLCIKNLDQSIKMGESISYQYALQLSFYIKKFFDVDGLADYWWKRDRRNRSYSTLEDFKSSRRDLMYHFQHQYGGGGVLTDYRPMKCKTCQSGDRFCFFTQRPEIIERKLRKMYQEKYADNLSNLLRSIKKIVSFVKNRKYGTACGFELSLRLNINPIDLKQWKSLTIYHPLFQYYKTCIAIKNGEKPPKNKPKI